MAKKRIHFDETTRKLNFLILFLSRSPFLIEVRKLDKDHLLSSFFREVFVIANKNLQRIGKLSNDLSYLKFSSRETSVIITFQTRAKL